MTYPIYPCSELADALIPADIQRLTTPIQIASQESKYPFRSLQVAMSFQVPHSEVTYFGVHTAAHKAGKRLGRLFKVINHKQHSVYEVVRIK